MKSYRIKSLILNNFGGLLGSFLANGDTASTPKRVNHEFSGIWTCKFEFSTIKTTIKMYIMTLLTKVRKRPQNGAF